MNYKTMIENGTIPEYITSEQAARACSVHPKHLDRIIRKRRIKNKKLDNGECVVSTLSLLECFDRITKQDNMDCLKEQLRYLKELKEGVINPRIPQDNTIYIKDLEYL